MIRQRKLVLWFACFDPRDPGHSNFAPMTDVLDQIRMAAVVIDEGRAIRGPTHGRMMNDPYWVRTPEDYLP